MRIKCPAQERITMGAFHYAKYSGNFGRNSNGKVRFSFFRPEYLGSPLEVVHLFSVGIFPPKFAVSFLTNRFFALIREFRKGIKGGKINSNWLARCSRKMSVRFPQVFPLISDRSVWHNGSTQCPRPGIKPGPLDPACGHPPPVDATIIVSNKCPNIGDIFVTQMITILQKNNPFEPPLILD